MRDCKGSCGNISFAFAGRNVKVFGLTEASGKANVETASINSRNQYNVEVHMCY